MKKVLELEYEAEDHVADIIDKIQELAAELGWSMAIPDGDEDGTVDHLIIGNLGALVEIDRTFEIYDIFEPPTEEENDTYH